ncbi:MAG TPA: RES family NAD+ phosphorylase [Hyphomicrobiaceae bacterium]|nr:RES family NAD+ phosphorylase [Hyphomicrobiaceae bacterium]
MASQPDLFIDRALVESIPVSRVRWKAAYRLVPSRWPPIDVFERVADADDWELLYELEALTNPRLRQEAGEISLVPPARRVTGPGASVVMAPFTHASPDRPTRFSDGTYGVYYAANRFETALREVAFHMSLFYGATEDPPQNEAYRTYRGAVDALMHDLRKGDWSMFLDPDVGTYRRPQELGRHLREAGSNGLVYPSVRHYKGQCIGAFWPDVVGIPIQTKHIMLKWDGERISAWFDYETERWERLSLP